MWTKVSMKRRECAGAAEGGGLQMAGYETTQEDEETSKGLSSVTVQHKDSLGLELSLAAGPSLLLLTLMCSLTINIHMAHISQTAPPCPPEPPSHPSPASWIHYKDFWVIAAQVDQPLAKQISCCQLSTTSKNIQN